MSEDSITGTTSTQADQLPRAGTTTSTATWSSEMRKPDACRLGLVLASPPGTTAVAAAVNRSCTPRLVDPVGKRGKAVVLHRPGDLAVGILAGPTLLHREQVGEVGVDEPLDQAHGGLRPEVTDLEVLPHALAHVTGAEDHQGRVGPARGRVAP